MEINLDGKVALITGGANGIGRETARRFAAAGATVALWDLAEEAGRAVATGIASAGGRATFDRVNVTEPEDVEAGVARLIEQEGRVDILINNAGILRDAQLVRVKEGQIRDRMTVEAFDAVVAVNLRGVFLCTRAVAPHMIAQGAGRIMSASSVVGLYGNFGQTNYVATKAGVIGMTRTWARELGRYGITVNAVAPGFIETDMTGGMPEQILAGMIRSTPLRRAGKPEDVANAYLFLASDLASFVSGAVLSVDGGSVVGT